MHLYNIEFGNKTNRLFLASLSISQNITSTSSLILKWHVLEYLCHGQYIIRRQTYVHLCFFNHLCMRSCKLKKVYQVLVPTTDNLGQANQVLNDPALFSISNIFRIFFREQIEHATQRF